jgi:formamidopyrimidine-DNA glycosylase
MPELPEVETVRLGLNRLLPGLRVTDAIHDTPKSFPNSQQDVQAFLIGATVISVRRRAKVLIIELSSNYALVIHLKMTGQLVFCGDYERFGAGHPNKSLVAVLPDKSTHVTLSFDTGAKLFFNDQRKFGWMRLMPSSEVQNIDFMRTVGPEPLETVFTWKVMRERMLRRKNSAIKAVLLDQTIIAGVGNIYADECLWGAKIHPSTLVRNVSDAQYRKLHEALVAVLRLSIEKGGSTDKNYVDAEGKKGSYLTFAHVFRREGQPCSRHPDTMIVKLRVAGRGTHICPICQSLFD